MIHPPGNSGGAVKKKAPLALDPPFIRASRRSSEGVSKTVYYPFLPLIRIMDGIMRFISCLLLLGKSIKAMQHRHGRFKGRSVGQRSAMSGLGKSPISSLLLPP